MAVTEQEYSALMQKMTDDFMKKVDQISADKEKEITRLFIKELENSVMLLLNLNEYKLNI